MRITRRAPGGVSQWLLREPADSAARLFCLPYSGCGAAMYRDWPRYIGHIEVCPVQLPSRDSRFAEPHFETYERLAAQLIDGLGPFLDRPFALFGHCGSALPAYEVSVQLAQRGGPVPSNLIVSSQVAPHDGPYGRLLGLTEAELAAEVRELMTELGMVVIDDLLEVYLEVLRADIEANKRYHSPPVRLAHPITAIGWDADTEVSPDLMHGWRDCGDTRFAVLHGRHYQFLKPTDQLLAVLEASLPANGSRPGKDSLR